MMEYFTQTEFDSNEYSWRPGEKRILVKIFYQVFNLMEANNRDLWKRHNSEEVDIDALYLKELFEDKTYFPKGAKVECQPLKTFTYFEDSLQKLDREHRQFDCYFFVFLTFSDADGRLQFSDSGLIPLQKIIDVVKKLQVTRGRPKIFLIQSDDITLTKEKEYLKGKLEFKRVKIPSDADQLIIQSTIPQEIVKPRVVDGLKREESFLIQAFAEAIKANSNELKNDFYSLTPEINGRVSKMIQECKPIREADMTVPLVTSTLTKLLRF